MFYSKLVSLQTLLKKFITCDSTIFYPPVGPPEIAQHPTPQHDMVPGSTVEFTVTATGGGDLTYKWQRDGADLNPPPERVSGETAATLQIDNVKKKHEGTYKCIVSNGAGPTSSKCAQLTVRKCFYLVFIIQQYMQPLSSVCVCVLRVRSAYGFVCFIVNL